MNRTFSEILMTIVVSAAAIGGGAFMVDWLKATGRWPKPKELGASSGDTDTVIAAGERL